MAGIMSTFTITRNRPSKTKSKPPQTEQTNDHVISKDTPQIPALDKWWATFRTLGRSEAAPSTPPVNGPALVPAVAARDGSNTPLVNRTAKPPELLKPREDGPSTISGDDSHPVPTGKASTGEDSGVSLREHTRSSGVVAELSTAPVVGLTIERTKTASEVSQPSQVPLGLSKGKGKGKEVDRRADPSGSAIGSSHHAISVRLPMSKLERLSKLNFVGSMDLRAQSVRMTKAEKTKLLAFSTFLSPAKTQIILFGKQMPRCRHRLVTLDIGTPPVPVKYICIEGLRDPADIKLFHRVMSQTRYRSYYEPWKLCYEASSISKPAASHYAVQGMNDTGTYCGAVLGFQDGPDKWLSTIGGLVEIGGQVYAMTTAHRPDEVSPSIGDDSSFPASLTDTLVEDNFPDDVESAYVFTPDTETHNFHPRASLERKFSTLSPLTFPPPSPSPFDLPYARPMIHGHDWQLIPVSRPRQLPNYFRAPWGGRKYIFDVCDSPSGQYVAVNAGISGICYGTLSLSASFLIGDDDLVQEIWTVEELERHTLGRIDLAQGDSGSWVLDITDPEDFTAVGHVVACSPGRAHVSLMSTEFEKVNLTTLGSDRVRLASPFEALLDYARSLTENGEGDRAKILVDEALSPKFLSKAASGSDLALTVQRFFAEVEDSPWLEVERELLEEVLTQYSDIASYLVDTSTFSGFEDRHATTFERLRKVYRAIGGEQNTHAKKPVPRLPATRNQPLLDVDKPGPFILPMPPRVGVTARLPELEVTANTDHPVVKTEPDNMGSR
ncbi:hypothetical protein B0T19DRAFT_201763 [Cercophora scortea]|uniref:Uncharacterized protein n=1 Tax=Cercophora scortea TaxID=314031 RepID=A0AAE0IE94_9PEZI|nr:hypothetical protein B0T19DRAFT_201763 [Cercophora scortea]